MIRKSTAALFILLSAAVIINVMTLKNGHNWGDDFAQYLINARNIIEGKTYASGVMLDNPTASPPGFSILLVPALKAVGLDFKALKAPNILWWYASIFLLYWVLKRRGGGEFAAASSVFLAFSSFFFVYKQNVLSDIPFFFFICLSLLLCEQRFIFFILAMSAALWVRSAGSIAFLAALIYFVIVKRDMRRAGWIVITFIVNQLVLLSLFGVQHGSFWTLAQAPVALLASAVGNLSVPFRSVWYFICPAQTIFSAALFKPVDLLFLYAAPFALLWLTYSFVRGLMRRSISFLDTFSFLYLFSLVIWSGVTTPVEAFVRYTLPFAPFLFVHIHEFMKGRGRSFLRVAFLVLLLLNLTNIILAWDFNDDAINQPQQRQMISWIKENTLQTDRIMFWKPRAIALMTSREGTAPWINLDQKGHLIQRITDFKISYIILMRHQDQDLIRQLESSKKFNLVWESETYDIFKSLEIHAP